MSAGQLSLPSLLGVGWQLRQVTLCSSEMEFH